MCNGVPPILLRACSPAPGNSQRAFLPLTPVFRGLLSALDWSTAASTLAEPHQPSCLYVTLSHWGQLCRGYPSAEPLLLGLLKCPVKVDESSSTGWRVGQKMLVIPHSLHHVSLCAGLGSLPQQHCQEGSVWWGNCNMPRGHWVFLFFFLFQK